MFNGNIKICFFIFAKGFSNEIFMILSFGFGCYGVKYYVIKFKFTFIIQCQNEKEID